MLSDMAPEPGRQPPAISRQQRKEQTRQALLAAARRVIERQGLAKMTTREVAQEAGVAAGTFFVHFPDLNILVETLLDERIAVALEEALHTLPTSDDLVGQLVHVARVLYDSYDAEPDLSRQYLAASLFHPSPQGPAERRIAEFQSWVTQRIAQAVAASALPAIDPVVGFTGYFSLYFGILVAGLRGQLDRSDQVALLDALLRRLFKMETQA
jgi:AcrR family transcriptional regulator